MRYCRSWGFTVYSYILTLGCTQVVTVSDSNGIAYPDAASTAFVDAFGSGVAPRVPLMIVAELAGAAASTRHDNCKVPRHSFNWY